MQKCLESEFGTGNGLMESFHPILSISPFRYQKALGGHLDMKATGWAFGVQSEFFGTLSICPKAGKTKNCPQASEVNLGLGLNVFFFFLVNP